VLHKLKDAYLVWFNFYSSMDKIHRYTLGLKIDDLLIAAAEAMSVASFLPKSDKLPAIRKAMRKIDTIKMLLYILFISQSIDQPHYIQISKLIEEISRMLYGWHNQTIKQNTPVNSTGASA